MKTKYSLLIPPLPQNPDQRLRYGQLYGASLPLVLSQVAMQHTNPTLIITANTGSATQLHNELKCFTKLETLIFPDWEILPYDRFSPHQDIISERLYILHRLPQLKQAIILVAANTLMHRLPPPHFITSQSFILKKGENIDLGNF